MIFRHLLLENLFSYQRAEFDFSGASTERNIALVFGRNGYGKTSFINAIKLLFAGANEDMRASVLPGTRLSPESYILGTGDEWVGIFNSVARRQGKKQCRVRLTWDEDDGEVEVERTWKLVDKSFQETLSVDIRGENSRHLEKEEAQQFLSERLPEDYLPFFFFDGEQIQRLAEANRSQTSREIERLLQLTPLDTLIEYLDKVAREWRKQEMPYSTQAQLKKLEAEKAELEARVAAGVEQREMLENERYDLTRLAEQEDLYLDTRRAGRLVAEEGPIRADLARTRETLETLQLRIAESLPANAFLLANSSLAARALEELNKLLDNPAGVQVEALKAILEGLPHDLFKPPAPMPPLSENQSRFYRDRLQRLLEAYIPDPSTSEHGLINLDPEPARQLRTVLEQAIQSASERDDRMFQLKEAVRLKRNIKQLEDKLNDISNLSPEEQQEYIERKAANDGRRERIGAIRKELEIQEGEIKDLTNKIDTKDSEIRSQERKVVLGEKNRLRLDRADQLKRFFVAYKNELKKRKRAAIEEALNLRFKQLMTSHDLIAHIRVDELFGVHYLDAEGAPIGMANISAGMKQLAATALLWALKEVSGKQVPLIVDTPLARIDLGNQKNLLTKYYPAASQQVIILPTDSEIDTVKHGLISAHIYREYQLENPAGQDSKVYELSNLAGEAAHV